MKKIRRRGLESLVLFHTDPEPGSLDDGGGAPAEPAGQVPDIPPAEPTEPPAPTIPAPKGEDDRVKALEAKLARAQKAKEKLEAAETARAESKKSDLEKAKARADLADEKRAASEKQLENMLRTNALRDAAAKTGVKSDRLAAVLKITDKSGITLGDDGELVGVEAAIEATKKDFPEFFGSPGTANPNTGGGKPGDRGGADDEPQTDYDVGRALARPSKKNKTRL